MIDYYPPRLLRSPHVQTVLSSRLLRRLGPQRAASAIPGTETIVLPAALNGGSAHLNREMFHSGRIDEVVAACNALCERYPAPGTGLMGYSLGGNFALRLLAHPQLTRAIRGGLSVCPVIDPAPAAELLDAGWAGYRWWFVKKWQHAMREKAAAFPEFYDFGDTFAEQSVVALTERFVDQHTDYPNAAQYYRDYTITNELLARIDRPTWLIAAADDPVLHIAPVRALKPTDHLQIAITEHGGHCAYLDSYRLSSSLGPFSTNLFDRLLRDGPGAGNPDLAALHV